MRKNTRESILAKPLTPTDQGCLLWEGQIDKLGYPRVRFGDDRGFRPMVHRLFYEWLIGPIPDGLILDHLCHNADPACHGGVCLHRRCVNIEHLAPKTKEQNCTDAAAGRDSCKRGHPYALYRTYRENQPSYCRECERLRQIEVRARKRSA